MALQQFDPDLLSPKRQRRAVRFEAFPEGSWEVVWLGDVAFHTRRRTFSQPTVKVVLRALDEAADKTVEIEVPVAQLFALHLGGIWRDKARTEEQVCDVEQRELLVHGANATQCMAGVMLEDGSDAFMLPFNEHPHHARHTKSWCVRVDTKDALFVFPALELIRFYFGSSGALLKRVFRPNLCPSELATASQMEDGLATITLAHDVPAASACDVARIVFDEEARAAASLVGSSLLAASATALGEKVYPRAVFPFKKVAQLQVEGLPIADDGKKQRFLVRRIVSCSGRFPFRELRFVASTRERGRRDVASADHRRDERQRDSKRVFSAGPVDALRNDEPSVRSSVKVVSEEPSARFPDLLRKTRTRIDGETQGLVKLTDLPPSPLGSTGEGASSGKGRRAELTGGSDDRAQMWKLKSPRPQWAPFFELVTALAKEEWVERLSFVPLDSRQVARHYSRVPHLVDEDGVVVGADSFGGGQEHVLASLVSFEVGRMHATLASLCPREVGCPAVVWLWRNVHVEQFSALALIAAMLRQQTQSTDAMLELPSVASDEILNAVRKVQASVAAVV